MTTPCLSALKTDDAVAFRHVADWVFEWLTDNRLPKDNTLANARSTTVEFTRCMLLYDAAMREASGVAKGHMLRLRDVSQSFEELPMC